MKKLKTHRYLLVTVMGLLVACTSYTSTDEWPNPRPNSNLTLNRSPERLPLFSRSIKVKM